MTIPAVSVPIHTDENGVIRIDDTRVTLDVVVGAYRRGDSPEYINESFPTLKLADIYAVIAYYLNNRDEVDAYLRQQAEEAAQLRREIEAHQPKAAQLRARLVAQRNTSPRD